MSDVIGHPRFGTAVNTEDRGDRGSRRRPTIYMIQIEPAYMEELLKGFRGAAAATFFRQQVSDLSRRPYSDWSVGTYGAWRRLLALIMQDAEAIRDRQIVVSSAVLRRYGILRRHLLKFDQSCPDLSICVLADCGEIRDLNASSAAREGEG